MNITDIVNPWRLRWRDAYFRTAKFFVESNARQGGRRIAMHEYPKRNVPYAEDMGRKATRIVVQGYLIGPNYWEDKNVLITALERDGPGLLRLPLPYLMADVRVMVASYSVTENRERGGFCTVEMEFSEYGDPENRGETSTVGNINGSALALEDNEIGNPDPTKAGPYAQLHNSVNAGVPTGFQRGLVPMTAAYKARLADFRKYNR
jgi:hypothetical protein